MGCRRGTTAIALGLVLTGGACSDVDDGVPLPSPEANDRVRSSTAPPSDTEQTSAAASAPEPLWRWEASLLSEPVETGGLLVSYVQPEDDAPSSTLVLAAVDATSGTDVWSLEVTRSAATRITAPALLDGNNLIALVPSPSEPWVHLVEVDPTGAEVSRLAKLVYVSSLPWSCGDTVVCFSGYLEGADDYRTWEVGREGDAIVVDEHDPEDEPDLVERPGPDTNEQGEPVVARRDADGSVVWQRPYDELGLPSEQEEIAGGYRNAGGVYIHDVWYADPDGEDGALPIEDHLLLGIDALSGEELWRRVGAGLCGGAADLASDVVLVCEGDGLAEVDHSAGVLRFDEAQSVTLSGVVETTGEELWSREVTGTDWTAMDAGLSRPVDSSVEAARADGDTVLLDPQTGALASIEAEALVDGYTCFTTRDYEDVDGQVIHSAFLYFSCDADGRAQDPPTAKALEALVDRTPDLAVIADPRGITRFP